MKAKQAKELSRLLLRQILREATYLPDAQARKYIAAHALSRWRDSDPSKLKFQATERRAELFKNARTSLSILRRANNGERDPLLKVLHLTYGRTGKRRHQLLAPLLHLPPKQPPELTPQHRALLESQLKVKPPDTVRPQLRSIALKIPATNSWSQPTPDKRVANLTKAWYADILERTIAPLSSSDWNSLRLLAMGNVSKESIIRPRRQRPKVSNQALSPPSQLELSFGLNTRQNANHSKDGHEITRRFMCRLWRSVFAQCPTMSWDPDSNKWSVRWGCVVLDDLRKRQLAVYSKPDLI